MSAGLWIVNIFAALWGAGALAVLHQPAWCLAGPVAMSAVLLALELRAIAGRPAPPGRNRQVGRVVGLWSALEVAALIAAANILPHYGLARLAGPVAGVIVGLHFIGLAAGIPQRVFYLTGLAMIVVGAGAMFLPDPWPVPATGVGSAVVLWLTGLVMARGRSA